ncbi:hypothetical protein [Flavobacterium sp. FlaQc-28]|uniref:hypothetical protein n=1 Tax=Flavobacterium sp. FlaQc-28 TaxID=3374178 RepID=UPI003757847E
MAKQIKAIKCPQCGSSLHTILSEDNYLCSSCNTQFFLDNDDININVNHHIDQASSNSVNPNTLLKVIPIIFGLVAFIVLFSVLNTKGNDISKPYFGNSVFNTPVVVNNKILLLEFLSKSSLNNKETEECYFSFKDINSGKVEKREKIEGLDKLDSGKIELAKFSNNKTYIVFNNQKVYEVDVNGLNIKDMTVSMFEKDTLYTSGIAEISSYFGQSYGESFKTMTNLGKSYYYYPLVKRSFPSDTIYRIVNREQFKRAKDSIVYTVKAVSEKNEIQYNLFKITYRYNGGGPCDPITSLGRFYNKFENNPSLITYKNFTPNRLYMNAYLAYFDAKHLLIISSASASKQSRLLLQRIDTETGELLWTVPIKPENDRYTYFFKHNIHADKKFVLKLDNNYYAVVDDDGKNLKYVTVSNL